MNYHHKINYFHLFILKNIFMSLFLFFFLESHIHVLINDQPMNYFLYLFILEFWIAILHVWYLHDGIVQRFLLNTMVQLNTNRERLEMMRKKKKSKSHTHFDFFYLFFIFYNSVNMGIIIIFIVFFTIINMICCGVELDQHLLLIYMSIDYFKKYHVYKFIVF